jgi:hypothetical protein
MAYPACYYVSAPWYMLTNEEVPCSIAGGPNTSAKYVIWKRFGSYEKIMSWDGVLPVTYERQADAQLEEQERETELAEYEHRQQTGELTYWEKLQQFWEFGKDAQKTARTAGYITLALVGAGVLLYYVPASPVRKALGAKG